MAKKMLAVLLVSQVIVIVLGIIYGVLFLKEVKTGEINSNGVVYEYKIFNNNEYKVSVKDKNLVSYAKLSKEDLEMFDNADDDFKLLILKSNVLDSLYLNNPINQFIIFSLILSALVIIFVKKFTFRHWLLIALFANLIYMRPEMEVLIATTSIVVASGICYLFRDKIESKMAFMIGIISYGVLNEIRNIVYKIFTLDSFILNFIIIVSLLFLLKIYKKHEDIKA